MRFLTAGESHGPTVTAIVEGFPSNLPIDKERMQKELFKRQGGYGRGRRMQIENDTFIFGSGIRHGKTLGSPIMMEVQNDDFKHWTKIMGDEPLTEEQLRSKKIYLYFTQLGKCMYSGEPIDFENLVSANSNYDIDHIYPQSKTKDDSLNNRVLVKRGLNAQKSDSYPLSREIREKMRPYWEMLRSKIGRAHV